MRGFSDAVPNVNLTHLLTSYPPAAPGTVESLRSLKQNSWGLKSPMASRQWLPSALNTTVRLSE